ncbi:hypothetical protein ACLOJK_031929 [Asimina triloba]
MRRASPHPLHSLAAAATDVTMSSSRFPPRGQNQWRRGFCCRDGGGGGRGEPFVSGDSHSRTVRDANYGFRQGERGDYRIPGRYPMPSFRPMPSFSPMAPPPHAATPHRPRPPFRPRPDDYRSWEKALHRPPPHCGICFDNLVVLDFKRFTVLSYNILADYLARDHRHRLYFHIPPFILDWEWRKKRILIELGLWSPDIMCFQEVDRFQDLQEELQRQGYSGVWKRIVKEVVLVFQMRTGIPVDGCAIFWRTRRFKLLHEEHIEYDKLGLRNNIAQICVLEVRVLLDRAHAVSRDWNNAPVIICGDFNCIPKLNLSGLVKNLVSGQSSASTQKPQLNGPYLGRGFNKVQPPKDIPTVPSAAVDNPAGSINHTECECVADPAGKPFLDDCSRDNGTMSEAVVREKGQETALNGPSNKPGSTQREFTDVPTRTVNDYNHQDKLSIDHLNFYKSCLAVSALKDGSASIEMEGEKMEFSTKLDSCGEDGEEKLHGAVSSECCSSVADLGTDFSDLSLPKDVEILSSESVTIKEKINLSISQWSTDKDELLDESKRVFPVVDQEEAHLSPGKVAETMKEDKRSVANLSTTYSVEEMTRCGTEEESLSNINDKNKIFDLEESMQSLEVCSSAVNIQDCHLEVMEIAPVLQHSGVNQIGDNSNIICNKRESGAHTNKGEFPEKETSYDSQEEILSVASSSDQTILSSSLDVNESEKFPSLEGCGDIAQANVDRLDFTILDDSQLEELTTGLAADRSGSLDSKENEVERKVYDPHVWTPDEIAAASGNAGCTLVEHPLKLKSAYAQVEDYSGTRDSSREPQVTSYNRQFLGTVDYIWCSEDLQTVQVLDTIPKHVLQQTPGFPTRVAKAISASDGAPVPFVVSSPLSFPMDNVKPWIPSKDGSSAGLPRNWWQL